MSEKHKQILLAGNAAIAAGDHEAFIAICTEDTEWHFIGDLLLRGKDAVRRWMAESYIEPPVVTVENLIAEGDLLVAQGVVKMMDPDGTWREYDYCDVWEFRDEKLASLKAFVTERRG